MTEAGTRRGDRELLRGPGVGTDSSQLTLSWALVSTWLALATKGHGDRGQGTDRRGETERHRGKRGVERGSGKQETEKQGEKETERSPERQEREGGRIAWGGGRVS